MADDTLQHEPATDAAPVAVQTAPPFTDGEVAELRRRLNGDPDQHGASRFGWFLIGFIAALASIAVATLVFLAVSDRDDDGDINLDVPAVEVGVDG